MKPLVSAVIPNFNGEKTIGKTIQSIYDQKIDGVEIIVVDDMSADNSVSIIRKNFPKVRIVECKEKKYAAGARNIGIAHASGDYILFIDNDAYVDKGCVKIMLEEVKRQDIAYPKIIFENNAIFHPKTERQKKYITISACFMMKSNSLKKLYKMFGEFFDETYQIYWEDTEFFLRCRLCGLNAKYVADARVIHILKHASFSSRELFFFLCTRNAIYSYVKYSSIKKLSFKDNGQYDFIGISNITRYLFKMFLVNTLLNYSGLERFSSKIKNNTLKDKVNLFFRHDKITNKTQLYLLYLFFRAIFWNIKNLNTVSKKKFLLEQSINKYNVQLIGR
ncbi:MAG: glycosyltransferase [Candidatus Aenigmatarchaeota archaeon]